MLAVATVAAKGVRLPALLLHVLADARGQALGKRQSLLLEQTLESAAAAALLRLPAAGGGAVAEAAAAAGVAVGKAAAAPLSAAAALDIRLAFLLCLPQM